MHHKQMKEKGPPPLPTVNGQKMVVLRCLRRYRRSFVVAIFVAFILWQCAILPAGTLPSFRASTIAPASYVSWGRFEPLDILGYFNSGRPGQLCNQIKHENTVGVQSSITLEDDLDQVAEEMKSHPMVIYPEDLQDPTLEWSSVVNQTWARLAGSCAFLSDYSVFLCATRFVFFTGGSRYQPVISFIRGQLFDQDWVHLNNYTIQWKDQNVTFPLVFNITIPYEAGGCFYGPEDPRIIIEDVEDAEPVIVFNMRGEPEEYIRAMYIFRPFSNYSTRLVIRDKELNMAEKNWAPFFLSPTQPSSKAVTHPRREPSRYLHFVYDFQSLQILKCHLVTGECTFVFLQDIPGDLRPERRDLPGVLRGGTNFLQIPLPPSTKFKSTLHSTTSPMRAYVGIPRTTTPDICNDPFYRPNLVVMVTDGSHFHFAYASNSLSFGSSLFNPVALAADPCGAGRIVIANSISQWDTDGGRDVMTVTFSVNDATTQVARIQGLLDFVKNLPGLIDFMSWHDQMPGGASVLAQEHLQVQYNAAGDDVRFCAVEAAYDYTADYAAEWLLEHPREKEEEEEKAEEEEKEGEEEKAEEEKKDEAEEGNEGDAEEDKEDEAEEVKADELEVIKEDEVELINDYDPQDATVDDGETEIMDDGPTETKEDEKVSA